MGEEWTEALATRARWRVVADSGVCGYERGVSKASEKRLELDNEGEGVSGVDIDMGRGKAGVGRAKAGS